MCRLLLRENGILHLKGLSETAFPNPEFFFFELFINGILESLIEKTLLRTRKQEELSMKLIFSHDIPSLSYS